MLQGLYAAAAGMAAQQTRMDAVSNDLANVDTTGYQHSRLAFRDLLYVRDGVEGVQVGSGAAASDAGRSTAAGALQETGRSLDVALSGPGYLEVRTPGGAPALTRAGALQVDARGRLCTASGALVAGVRPVPAGSSADDLKIGEDGTVRTAEGTELGRLRVVTVPGPDGLRPVGDSLFVPTAASGTAHAAASTGPGATTVRQGALEGSNVDTSDAMVDLIESQRAFSMASRAIQTQDQMMEIANGVKR
ncbi:flagellar hook-basal body protein [Patulibacter sp. NPDC049589]|uniref:flagellar hook-basal body protein n=1 Tax=Patulibacter sp. NPDC049589 TaxID=3154731 RepID=UPI0034447A5B